MLSDLVQDNPCLMLDFLDAPGVVRAYEALGRDGMRRLRGMMAVTLSHFEGKGNDGQAYLPELRKQRATCRGVAAAVDALQVVPRLSEVRVAGSRWVADRHTAHVLARTLAYIETLMQCAREAAICSRCSLFAMDLENSPFRSAGGGRYGWTWKPCMLRFPRIHSHVTTHYAAMEQLSTAHDEALQVLSDVRRRRLYI